MHSGFITFNSLKTKNLEFSHHALQDDGRASGLAFYTFPKKSLTAAI